MKAGDILTETARLAPPAQRKVYLSLGPSRVPGKIRIATWSHQAKAWSNPHTKHVIDLCPAPEDWPQTKAVKRWLAEHGKVAGVLAAKGRRA